MSDKPTPTNADITTKAEEANQEERAEQIKRLLENVHTFPTDFKIKVIGSNTSSFIDKIRKKTEATLATHNNFRFETGSSSGGKYVSIRVIFTANSPEEITRLYEALRSVEGILFIA